MKFISWNVNGIRAAWGHGLSAFLDASGADIYAFQETKVSAPYHPVELENYHVYWSLCDRKKGYSGTVCLSRYEPLSVSYDLSSIISSEEASNPSNDSFDCEGRIITLEFAQFYFINCYFPNSQGSRERYDYRVEWDKRLRDYVRQLLSRKSVILCGDFNVAISDRDIYPENKWQEINAEGYQAAEREALLDIVNMGMVDSFRHIHPNSEAAFSWWSNRRNKRAENKGWRLDYFLLSFELTDLIRSAEILSEVYGSDHCPIMLDVALDMPEPLIKKVRRHKAKKYEIPPGSPYDRTSFVTRFSNAELGVVWDSIDWSLVEANVAQMQTALAKSAYSRNDSLIRKWQTRIVCSIDAKLLAVRHVCSSAGGKGIDKVVWTTSKEKMAAALSLTSKGYKAMPSRLLLVKSKNGNTRRIHVETWYDRSMQSLYALSLDPVAESWGDRKSFAFRRGRSHFDAHYFLVQAFDDRAQSDRRPAPEWGFLADVRQCYEHISHTWIEDHIPMAKSILHEFLTAGYMFAGQLYPMDEGVGIGLSLSPIVANMVLDGLQEFLYRRFYPKAYDETLSEGERPDIDYANGNMIRYADDIIIATRTKEEAIFAREVLKEFLGPRGLELSEKKSKIVNINDGFDFMSRTYIKKNGSIYIYPSAQSTERFMHRLKDTVDNHTGSQQTLIQKLNKKIDGWTTYHKVEYAQEAFRHVDVYLKAILLESCEKKHPKWDRARILDKYWYRDEGSEYRYALPDKKEVRVKRLKDAILISYHPVRTNLNPYIETEYLDWRTNTREINNVTGIYRAIWNRQEGKCYYCGCHILSDQERTLMEINGSAKKRTSRYAYIHSRCAERSVDFLETDTLPDTATDVMALLEHLDRETRQKGQRFLPLGEFFRSSTKPSITVTFSEIEAILGFPLGKSAESSQWWTRTGFMNISQSWLDNGYEIKRISIEKKRITFHQTNKNVSSVNIPEMFFTERIPDEAKYELENYFSYIIKKYGL